MRPYAATLRQMLIMRGYRKKSKDRRDRRPVRAEKKAARRAGQVEIKREVYEDEVAREAIAAEEKRWNDEILWDMVMDPYDNDDWRDEEMEPHVDLSAYDDDNYYRMMINDLDDPVEDVEKPCAPR